MQTSDELTTAAEELKNSVAAADAALKAAMAVSFGESIDADALKIAVGRHRAAVRVAIDRYVESAHSAAERRRVEADRQIKERAAKAREDAEVAVADARNRSKGGEQ